MLDLSFGLPMIVRNAALKMVAPGPQSEINREFFAQNNEKAIEEGRGGVKEYEKTDEKARELLRRLAQSKPYFRKGRTVDEEGNATGESSKAFIQRPRLGNMGMLSIKPIVWPFQTSRNQSTRRA
ncbi:hypothetical protein FJTKL_15363 [Diaporthe vaccinii]|uniref:Uncharacterized protein n=1 Tax=Diaporthe vaccinii TaxID=105482 RepID=A0ABR4E581_9PEZI